MTDMQGKVGFITGGGSGIGLGTAQALARNGARVALMGRDADRLQRAAATFADPARVVTVTGDVASEADVERAVATVVERCGRLDFAGNAAGIGSFGSVHDQDYASWSFTLRTNLDGTMLALKHETAAMLKLGNGGAIVNVSSIAGVLTHRMMSAYCVSKAADVQLARNLAAELGPHGIRVNCISPGLVKTDFAKALWEDPDTKEQREEETPLRRIGEPNDIAGAAVFLASRAGAWLTGQNIVVDGGVTAV